MRTRSMLAEHSEMIGCGIAPMTGKSILGKLPVQPIHDPITGHLGENACRRNTQTQTIPADKCGLLNGKSLNRKPINQGMSRRMSVFLQLIQGASHCQVGGPEDVELSDFL